MAKRKKRSERRAGKQKRKERRHARRLAARRGQSRPHLDGLAMDYTTLPFLVFHEDIQGPGGVSEEPPAKRRSFWQLVPPGRYAAAEARPLLRSYAASVEEELGRELGAHSVAYWLQVYRRLSPGGIGPDKSPGAIAVTRATLEAAIQKYGQHQPCAGVAISTEVAPERILRGKLVELAGAEGGNSGRPPLLRQVLEDIRTKPQLVLTDFGTDELRQFYQCERLAYEIWRTMSLCRTVAKGASLIVEDNPVEVFDDRSDELDRLLRIYDRRNRFEGVSATGTVFPDPFDQQRPRGTVLLPSYNAHRIEASAFNEYFRNAFGFEWRMLAGEQAFNFVWWPFKLMGFYQAHRPLADAFEAKYGPSLESVVALVGGLYLRMSAQWRHDPVRWTYRAYQRAHEGPYTRDYIIEQMRIYSRQAAGWLELERRLSDADVDHAIAFLSLSESRTEAIGVDTHGPHAVFLPYGDGRVFIDYAYVRHRLYYLFFGVRLDDENFKGTALEELVGPSTAGLPRIFRAEDGTEKEIDATFEVGDALVIVECKARARSIGFDRGDPLAIEYRRRVVEEIIGDADDKAEWLAQHPTGRNYDIRRFARILPVGVSPFVEFIHSAAPEYWLTDDLPRVLTPTELKAALEDGTLVQAMSSSSSVVQLRRDPHNDDS